MQKKRKADGPKYVLDENNRITGIHWDGDLRFRYSLNLQANSFYAFVGTLSLLDPYIPETMKIFDSNADTNVPASKQIHVPDPRGGEDYATLIDIEINKVACELKCLYQSQYNQNQKNGKLLYEMTLYEAELAFLKEASRDFSESASVQSRFCSSIRKFSKALPDVKVEKITKSDFKKVISSVKDGKRMIEDLKSFIEFIENQQKMSSGCLTKIEDAISSIPKKDSKAENDRAAKNASNSDALSPEAEKELDCRLAENKHVAKFVAVGLVKGSGLDASEISRLKMSQVQRYPEYKEIVFLKIKREYSGSATQDYTFPIFPIEAMLLNEYIDALSRANGEERLDGEKYLFSHDGGVNPIDSSEIIQCCKAELIRLKFGYADLIGNVNLQKSKGIELLKKTYRVRLEDECGLKKSTDEGAYLFMLHQSLGNKVQPDYYRGFTGESGREHLIDIVLQDHRYIQLMETTAVPKEKTDMHYETKGERREYVLFKKDHRNVQQAVFDVILKPGDKISFGADYGCEVTVDDVILI